jgi:hypothetical protein
MGSDPQGLTPRVGLAEPGCLWEADFYASFTSGNCLRLRA